MVTDSNLMEEIVINNLRTDIECSMHNVSYR